MTMIPKPGDVIVLHHTVTAVDLHRAYFSQNYRTQACRFDDIEAIIPAPWVPKVGDKYARTERGIYGWKIRDEGNEFFTVESPHGTLHSVRKLNFTDGRTKVDG